MNPGDLVGGRFEIEREAGVGGMGTVYRARDRQTGAPVAVKVLLAQGNLDQERFVRESTTLSELTHPGIVRYVANGTTPSGERFLAMEWLQGEDLADRLARSGLTLAESVTVVRRAAEALAIAHARGIVHRDIKPSNLYLVEGDVARVKVLDFGIARRTRDQRGLTRTGVLLGTPEYMAPEQARGSRSVDARADVFALGAVLFECATGRPAFVGENLMAVLAKILLENAPRIADIRPDVPADLDAFVARLLAKNPDERPADAAEVVRGFDALGPMEAGGATKTSPTSVRPPALTTHEQRVVSLVLAGAHHPSTDELGPTLRIEPADTLRERLEPIVQAHRGRVEAPVNGGVLATLSGAGTLTDLAARAARCALAMRKALPDPPMALVTGRAVVSETVPMGEVIDRAARVLMVAQERGPVRIDEATAGLVDARFDLGTDGAGLYLVTERPQGAQARTVLGRKTSCVGRDRELATLEAMYDEAVSEPIARAALVLGTAGSGKSRIVSELVRRLLARDDAPLVITARGDSVRAGAAFGMLSLAIRELVGIAEGEPKEGQRRRIRARVTQHLPAADVDRVTDFLCELAEVPPGGEVTPAVHAARENPQIMHDAMRTAFEDWLAAECTAQPVLFVLEDLHWGDLPMVGFFDSALRILHDRPFMVLALARPDVRETFPNLWAEREVQEIRLGALTKKASEKLVREVLGDAATPEIVARIVERSEGNAFFLEELIRAVGAGTDARQLPETVLGMAQARLDSLSADERRVLRAGSVFGAAFWRGGVLKLLGQDHRTINVAEWLESLVAREVIEHAATSTMKGETEFHFRHALVRDAAYAMLTEHDRALGHRLAGEWLESMGFHNAAVLSEHYDRGGDAANATRWYAIAAREALDGNDVAAAIKLAERGVELGATGAVRGEMLRAKGEAHYWRGEYALCEAAADDGVQCFEPGTRPWFHAQLGRLLGKGSQGKLDEAEVVLRATIETEPQPDAVEAKLLTVSRGALPFLQSGRRHVSDLVQNELAQLEPRVRKFPDVRAALLGAKRNPFNADEDLDVAIAWIHDTVRSLEEAGDVRGANFQRSNTAFILAELGQFDLAEPALRKVVAECERYGFDNVRATALHNLGDVMLVKGDVQEAVSIQRRSIETFERHNNPRLLAAARISYARALVAAGNATQAESEARKALALAEASAPGMMPMAQMEISNALVALGRSDEALTYARAGLIEQERTVVWRRFRVRAPAALVRALVAAGKLDEARAVAKDARAAVDVGFARMRDPARRAQFAALPEVALIIEWSGGA